MAPIDLYSFSISPPCRAVFSTAQVLGVEVNEKNLNLFEGEHLKEDFLKVFTKILFCLQYFNKNFHFSLS